MADLRRELRGLSMPAHIRTLPIDARGYPVPFFVAVVDGVPDHRVADPAKRRLCIDQDLCWICGKRLGSYLAFVIGPMCAVNRISGDAPMHRDCAEYSIKACPFLTRPHMVRREAGMPETAVKAAGEMIERNPGVMLLWITRGWKPKYDADHRMLFALMEPLHVTAFREGRIATRTEIRESVASGVPLLAEMCRTVIEARELQSEVDRAVALLEIDPITVEWTPPPPAEKPGRIVQPQAAPLIVGPGAV
jgi:hypothetical protein